jgi:hypothetical protein
VSRVASGSVATSDVHLNVHERRRDELTTQKNRVSESISPRTAHNSAHTRAAGWRDRSRWPSHPASPRRGRNRHWRVPQAHFARVQARRWKLRWPLQAEDAARVTGTRRRLHPRHPAPDRHSSGRDPNRYRCNPREAGKKPRQKAFSFAATIDSKSRIASLILSRSPAPHSAAGEHFLDLGGQLLEAEGLG